MTVIVIEPPSPVVSVEEAKRHLRIDHSDDDALIEGFIAAVTAWLDGPDGWLGRAIGGQVLEWQLDCWPCRDDFSLPYPPAGAVISVTYVDPDGAEQAWTFPEPLYFEAMPSVRGRKADIKIRYRAGYGAFNNEEPPVWINAAPAAIKVAIMMIVAQWHANPEASVIGLSVETMPIGAMALLNTFRLYR